MNIPDDLYYTKDHEWAKIENGKVRMGVTDYAQHELGDIVFVDLKPKGSKVNKGDSVGTIESVKAVSEVYAPLTGSITEANPDLETSPELVNQDCYGKGWMVVIAVTSTEEISGLMDAAAYKEYLAKEAK
jgi:glycine cleavage system H protein